VLLYCCELPIARPIAKGIPSPPNMDRGTPEVKPVSRVGWVKPLAGSKLTLVQRLDILSPNESAARGTQTRKDSAGN